jgi:hypothetical protein
LKSEAGQNVSSSTRVPLFRETKEVLVAKLVDEGVDVDVELDEELPAFVVLDEMGLEEVLADDELVLPVVVLFEIFVEYITAIPAIMIITTIIPMTIAREMALRKLRP